MKSTSEHVVVALIVLALTSCNVSSVQSNVSSRRDGAHPAAGTSEGGSEAGQPVPTVHTENGAMLSKDSTEAMKMSGTSSDVVINPGSLTVDTQVSIADYKRSDPNYIAHELGLESGEVEAVGITQVKGSNTESLAKPMTITLEIGSNLLEFFLSEPYYFVICSAFKTGQGPKVWTIANEDIVVTGHTLQFQTKEFGVFEVFKAYRPVPKVKEMRVAAMNAFAEPVVVSGLSTSALAAGKTVTIEGAHLGDDTHVRVGGHHATITAFASDKVSFIVPELDEFGYQTLKVRNRYNIITKDVFYKGSKSDLPLIAQKPVEVCIGTAYYNPQGAKRIGTKVCSLADARPCTGANKNDCLLGTSFTAIDPSTVPAGNLALGYSLAGVEGTTDLEEGLTICDHDGHVGCRAKGAYKAMQKSSLQAEAIPRNVTLAGVAGTFPALRPACSQAETSGCDIASASSTLLAVKDSVLVPTIIRNGVTIGGQTGTYPSGSNPLIGSSFPSLTASNAPEKLVSAATFEFFDRNGNRYIKQGDADLIAQNIVSGVTVWGVEGSYQKDNPVAEGSAFDYRWDYSYKDMTSGKVKINCRSLVLPSSNSNLPADNVAGHLWEQPNQNPWGDEKFACRSEGWTVHTPNCSPTSQMNSARCVVQDKKTNLYWTTAGMLDGSATQAQVHCEAATAKGFDDWRVPTQKEAMQAVINGISSLTPDIFRFTNGSRLYWTSTIPRAQAGASEPLYWNIDMTSGIISTSDTGKQHYLCVRGG